MTPVQNFSKEGQAFLDAFYTATRTPLTDSEAKVTSLREHFIKEEMTVTSAEGDTSVEMELRALEYYFLMKNGIEE